MTRRGTTLVEVIVYCFMLCLVVYGVYSVVVASVRGYVLEANQNELQQGLMGAMARLSWELTESDPAACRVDASPAAIIFASPRDDDGRFQHDSQGNLLWHRYVCYYVGSVNGTSALIRKEQKLASASSTPPAIPATLTTSGFSGPVLWSSPNISALTFSGDNPLDVTLIATRRAAVPDRSGSGIVDSIRIESRVYLRN